MNKITVILNEIAQEALRLGINVNSDMNQPTSRENIAFCLKKCPLLLPQEILEVYLWKNGVRLVGQPNEIRIFPNLNILPIEDAATNSAILIGSGNSTTWKSTWFCFCSDLAGDYYACESSAVNAGFGKIYRFPGI